MIQLSTKPFPLPRPMRQLEIAPSELHLWRISFDEGQSIVDELHKQLSEAEQLKASKYFREDQAQKYVVFHAALRDILARYLDVEPAGITYETSQFGKPNVIRGQADGLQFNLTHSGELAVVAVSHDIEVGVDIERIREVRSFASMLERCLSDAERKDICAHQEPDRYRQFLRFWTHKEAYLKTVGVGLRAPLDRLTLDLQAPEARKVVNHFDVFPQKPAVRLMELAPCEGFVGAVGTTHDVSPEIKTFGWVSGRFGG
ncbi:4'-phosphopantetheinyl transferase family protein [Bremerella sp. T1]|uniref:4'-phosphopantetheinyl transferase family protein n=1 Tax=Bremerella sp. TYQ1 TaxID=3119568 RepID=UPI001CCDC728|nr:4'-phosphopantetheinyl transferase superfamily protein [Bremerella volcania]UBM34771.1 4'-phosphopantetheinyl transferase superfamily protein [Bremerella volcania]